MNIQRFFQREGEALGLRLVAGGGGVGRLLQALENVLILPKVSRRLSFNLFEPYSCVVLCNDQPSTDELNSFCDDQALPLFCSSQSDVSIAKALSRCLSEQTGDTKQLPPVGTMLKVLDTGVLLVGPSGVGKSDVALGLVDRGHALIVDDGPEFSSNSSGEIEVSCPSGFEKLLEVRGVGIVDITQLYGHEAWLPRYRLDLVIDLGAKELSNERLKPNYDVVSINSIELPLLNLPIDQRRNTPLLVEVAVKQYHLMSQGYDAAQNLTAQLTSTLSRETL